MNLQQIKKDIEELRRLNKEYDTVMVNKKEVDLKLKKLKQDYDRGKTGREIFSDYNKKSNVVVNKLKEIKTNIIKFTRDINKNAR